MKQQQIQDAKSIKELDELAIRVIQEMFSPDNKFEELYDEWNKKRTAFQEKRIRQIVQEELVKRQDGLSIALTAEEIADKLKSRLTRNNIFDHD
ncbi:hypothetical protein PV433_30910 [Paenibacillus sp. GYB004]|uniref:hypothetical protein n=1 Tax=Paenibacillus sp. GYB004 TaxID=2994393 RepID=UPI002F96268E